MDDILGFSTLLASVAAVFFIFGGMFQASHQQCPIAPTITLECKSFDVKTGNCQSYGRKDGE